jgi:hypothetical protein
MFGFTSKSIAEDKNTFQELKKKRLKETETETALEQSKNSILSDKAKVLFEGENMKENFIFIFECNYFINF